MRLSNGGGLRGALEEASAEEASPPPNGFISAPKGLLPPLPFGDVVEGVALFVLPASKSPMRPRKLPRRLEVGLIASPLNGLLGGVPRD